MQFSKKVASLARLHGIDPKDVLFAILYTDGASAAEAFAVIYRPAATTTNSLATKASLYIGQRPGLRRLIDELNQERAEANPDQPTAKRGRPRKDATPTADEDAPAIDYTDKDALLKELARIAERTDKDSDRLAALREIGSLQRMKQEAAVENEKRVIFYIPLDYEHAEELREYLKKYYAER